LLAAASVFGAVDCGAGHCQVSPEPSMSTQKQQAVELIEAVEPGAAEPVGLINPTKYIQHNPRAEDGPAGLRKLLETLRQGSARAHPVRVFQDGDYVFAHTDYDYLGPKTSFDIFRFEHGKIVEHWDNLQGTAGPNPSGNTMTNGPTQATDLEKTEPNKALVRQFVDDILVHGRMDRIAGYFSGDNYIQHDPQLANGLAGLRAALAAMAKAGVTRKYDRIHQVLGEGNFVLVVSEGAVGGKPTSFYDLFRVENGKIAEHWDTIETIPPRSEWKNQNGKFDF
jgi:predicted SnoaL-like aldol condensation-catalyzing enzyme